MSSLRDRDVLENFFTHENGLSEMRAPSQHKVE